MAARYDYTWHQGEDFNISLVYKAGTAGAEAPVNLSTYSLRMDIAAPNGTVLTVLNDKNITDTDPYTPGSQADTSYEVTLGTAGQISILLGRALTLPGGAFERYLSANPSQSNFSYDIFLRDAGGKQTKILYGTLALVKSVTKWQ